LFSHEERKSNQLLLKCNNERVTEFKKEIDYEILVTHNFRIDIAPALIFTSKYIL
jgi:hypothetical protein